MKQQAKQPVGQRCKSALGLCRCDFPHDAQTLKAIAESLRAELLIGERKCRRLWRTAGQLRGQLRDAIQFIAAQQLDLATRSKP